MDKGLTGILVPHEDYEPLKDMLSVNHLFMSPKEPREHFLMFMQGGVFGKAVPVIKGDVTEPTAETKPAL